ncbi:hypothetical protein M408DRAFT_330126 [Serendipita vermifera MAFF 305830]|uniref:Uncharacterized protein n=1 Tax=Serendipita vermifera MAFF 305830 TaxID=933852 RepID=A0A0C3ARL4_SERVB|nr:hypothetical protein M408DRAFT_330126 [Serendipita vermifera MAFF 305830]
MSRPSRRITTRHQVISQATSSRTNQPYSEEGRNNSIASRRLRAARGNDDEGSSSKYPQRAERARNREQSRTRKVIRTKSLHNAQGLRMKGVGHDQRPLEQPMRSGSTFTDKANWPTNSSCPLPHRCRFNDGRVE